MKRREQLQADRKRENSRLDKIINKDISDSINDHIDWLNKQIKEIEKKLSSSENIEEIEKNLTLLTSIPAVGKLTAYYLISFFLKLENCQIKH